MVALYSYEISFTEVGSVIFVAVFVKSIQNERDRQAGYLGSPGA